MMRGLGVVLVVVLCVLAMALATMPARSTFPQVISHRGASGYLPEHSLQAYQTAIDLKTDYIEPDLCISKDGVFVAMHDLLLDDTTNVASLPQYADRKTTKTVDGKPMTGYFVSDFLYSELEDLRLTQRLSQRTKLYNNYFTIPSFDQIMSLAQTNYNTTKRTVGIYVELKHPTFHKSIGFDMEDMLLQSLQKGGYAVSGDSVPHNLHDVLPVVIQCFEADSLKYLKSKTSIPLIQLFEQSGAAFYNSTTFKDVASYANGFGPHKADFGNPAFTNGLSMMNMAHSYNLSVHPWTFRADQDILSKFHNDFFKEEMYFYCCLGMDAVFSEFPDRSRETIDVMKNFTAWNDQSMKKNTASSPLCVIDCNSP